MKAVSINTSKNYICNIGSGLINQCGSLINEVLPLCKIALITDSNVDKLYADSVSFSLTDFGYTVKKIVVPSGENSKSFNNYEKCINYLAENQFVRSDGIVALGGGVVGDLGGFVASTYTRGIGYVQLPTTLLAAIDSSVGGKTAINLTYGKNLVGTFCQPLKVIFDIDTLTTLPEEIFLDGLAEGVKYGILKGGELWELLQSGIKDNLERFVELCVRAKKYYVENDELDKGVRMHLNLGHTFGHALEKASGYSLLHGFAVVKGIVIIADLSSKLGLLDSDSYQSIINLLNKYGYDTECGYSINQLTETIKTDKKVNGNLLNLIVIKEIGNVIIKQLSIKELEALLDVCGDR